MKEHKLDQKVANLEARCSEMEPNDIRDEYDEIDEIWTDGLLLAEQKCRKLKVGGVLWTPKLQLWMDRITFWQNFRKKREGQRIKLKLLRRQAKKIGMKQDFKTIGRKQAISEEAKAKKEYYKVKEKNKKGGRETWQAELAEEKAKEGNTTKEKVLRNMIRKEHERKSWKRIKAVNGKLCAGAIKEVEVPAGNGGWKKVTDQPEMERGCLEENIRRLLHPSKRHPIYAVTTTRRDRSHRNYGTSTRNSERRLSTARGGRPLHNTAY